MIDAHVAAVTRDYIVEPNVGTHTNQHVHDREKKRLREKADLLSSTPPSSSFRFLHLVLIPPDYRTLSAVKGPLVILDRVKVPFLCTTPC